MIKTVLLGDIAQKITKGTTPTTYGAKFTDTGVNFVKVESITAQGGFLTDKFVHIDENTHKNMLKRSIIEEGDILLTMAGAIGRVAQVSKEILPANTNQAVSIIRIDNDSVDSQYIRYFLESPDAKKQFLGGITQSAQPNLSLGNISKIQVPLPNLETQMKIVNILGTIDEKIELNRQMNETLERMGQALFRHYFIDNPEAEKWDRMPLSELCEKVASGGTPATKREDYYGGDVQWYSTKELRDGFLSSSEKTITEDGLSNSAAKLFPENTIVMAIYAAPTVGRLGILTSEASFNQAACGLIARPEVGYEFIYLYLLLSRTELNNLANGAAQQNISVGKVRDFKVMKPNEDALAHFRKQIAPIFATIKGSSEQIQTLTTLRDTLLPRLINGKVKI